MIVSFSEHLTELMKRDRLTNAELARRSGVSHVAIGNYLNGRIPKYEVAEKLAAVFGVTPDYLLSPTKYERAPMGLTIRRPDDIPNGEVEWARRALAAEQGLEKLKDQLSALQVTIEETLRMMKK